MSKIVCLNAYKGRTLWKNLLLLPGFSFVNHINSAVFCCRGHYFKVVFITHKKNIIEMLVVPIAIACEWIIGSGLSNAVSLILRTMD